MRVVEAMPVSYKSDSEMPNESVDALRVLATGGSPSSECLVVAAMKDWDDGKRAFDNMSVADQQLPGYFDTGRLHKRRKGIAGGRLPLFRSHLSSASAGAGHANYQ